MLVALEQQLEDLDLGTARHSQSDDESSSGSEENMRTRQQAKPIPAVQSEGDHQADPNPIEPQISNDSIGMRAK